MKFTRKSLTYIQRHAPLTQPEAAKVFIATLNFATGYRKNLCTAYNQYWKFTQTQWNKPRYEQEAKNISLAPKEKLLMVIAEAGRYLGTRAKVSEPSKAKLNSACVSESFKAWIWSNTMLWKRKAERIMKKNLELKLVSELFKNSDRSDRELAKVLGVSQPTISRTRSRLKKEGVIKEHTVIPDFGKLGIELVAITFGAWSPAKIKEYSEDERVEKAKRFLSEHQNVIFASSGSGLGKGRAMISLHKNYTDYSQFIQQAKTEWAGLVDLESFIISTKSDIAPFPFSFGNLGKYIERIVARE